MRIFAVFPKGLVRPCILAGSRPNDVIFDPFYGAGTVGIIAKELTRRCIGIELKEEYINIAGKRTSAVQTMLIPAV